MKIKLKVDYNEHHKKGGDGEGLPDTLKRKLVKAGLADAVGSTAGAAPTKPKRKSRRAARAVPAPEGHRPLAGAPAPVTTKPAVAPDA